ncbi:MAG: hypothetical protein DYH08_06965, partial [Actinobacteria bacterium ATB1]|nr:hypothetical protein [Actinobacteria bacterium ATB1]
MGLRRLPGPAPCQGPEQDQTFPEGLLPEEDPRGVGLRFHPAQCVGEQPPAADLTPAVERPPPAADLTEPGRTRVRGPRREA